VSQAAFGGRGESWSAGRIPPEFPPVRVLGPDKGRLEHTIPDTPNSRLQKYRLTQAGRRVLSGATKMSRPRTVQ